MSGPRLAATEPGEAAMAPSPRIFRLSRYPTRTAPAAPGRLWSHAQPPAAPSGLLMRRDGPVTHPRQQRRGRPCRHPAPGRAGIAVGTQRHSPAPTDLRAAINDRSPAQEE
jgi:hypothetical protein